MLPACPACSGKETVQHNEPTVHALCPLCGHRWLETTGIPLAQQHNYYAQLRGRNILADSACHQKMTDRLHDLAPLLHDGMRILEIGCAEGELGRRIKAIANIEYSGIELSEDALVAAQWLDHVSRHAAAALTGGPYDLILSFHVLEHISDIHTELGHWASLLKPTGKLVVEVPNEAGHPLLSWDTNIEHIHQFTATSLSASLHQAGFSVQQLTSGHFESVVYSDSLRAQAHLRSAAQTRSRQLIAGFKRVFPDKFVIYGIGGDFNNYIAPILSELPVVALADSDPRRHGIGMGDYRIEAFDSVKFNGLPVLVTSLRYQAEIKAALQEQGVPSHAIYGLDAIFG
jgi:2-polyprenyl-3-methyl-5-hydroxy-6-metoxy-1,4-benzoquinol methylase